MSDFSAEVTKGAALLDRVYPGWHKEIAVDCLAMDSCDKCILGHIYGDYWDGCMRIANTFRSDQNFSSASFGFTIRDRLQLGPNDEVSARFRALADRWREAIKQREVADAEMHA